MTAIGALGWYIYAVMPARCAAAAAALAGEAAVLPGAAVGAVDTSGLAALTSLVPLALFQAETTAAADPAWVAARATAHHQVVTAISQAGPCLPLGYGTIFGTADAVRAWLASGAARLTRALAAVAGKAEWAVSLVADTAARQAWLNANDPALRDLAARAAAASPGTRFLIERQAARAQSAALLARDAADAAWLHADLTARGWAARQDGAAAWSVLADRGADLPAALAGHAPGLAESGLSLRIAGPFPPYAFARAAWQELTDA